jgi:hypothetical protein
MMEKLHLHSISLSKQQIYKKPKKMTKLHKEVKMKVHQRKKKKKKAQSSEPILSLPNFSRNQF